MLGKNHSEDTKQKMSESAKQRPSFSPSKDTREKKSKIMSMTRWINKDGTNKRAQLDCLHEFLNSGWILGKINSQ